MTKTNNQIVIIGGGHNGLVCAAYLAQSGQKVLVLEASDSPGGLAMARERVHFQGLPSRICWLSYGERAKMGLVFNELVAKGEIQAPIVIGRDHLDCGSVASPYRETEGMKDGSDAIADWPILNALLNTACGASCSNARCSCTRS